MSRRSCFQFTNIARERTGRGSGSRSALGSSVRRRRAGARAAAQSQVGGRCGGARGLPKPGGVAACGTCQEDEASAPPVSVFPLCHGAHIPQNTWGRGLRVHLRFRARTGIGWGRRRPGRGCGRVPTTPAPGWRLTPGWLPWSPWPSSRLSGPQCCPGGDKSTLFVSSVPRKG